MYMCEHDNMMCLVHPTFDFLVMIGSTHAKYFTRRRLSIPECGCKCYYASRCALSGLGNQYASDNKHAATIG